MDDQVVSNEGTKRRLPLWMSGDQEREKSETVDSNKTDSVDEGRRIDGERIKKNGRRPKSKSFEKGNDDSGLALEEESSSLIRKCRERKQSRSEVVNHDVDINVDVAVKKKKRRGRIKMNPEVENNEDVEGGVENGEDEDLTMDDLMTIAKEYVQEGIDTKLDVSSKRGHMAGSQSEDIDQSGNSGTFPRGNRRSFEDHASSSCSAPTANPTHVADGFKPAMSGNPTQDMLDLFLGPLLKKTQEQDKEGGLIAEETKFTYEAKRQHRSGVLGEEPVVLVKKKSSLKDKVAMFLD
ncbi:hypothetical protein ACH5RR_015707 [Cinchona calisaya]|uniref:Uncharacterized protein n=1 Tax=Cinchona calisaya TaxID=153742 RepID=A0ABD2ZZA7_9GENT